MIRTVVAFLLGATLATGATAVAVDRGPAQVHCFEWANGSTDQCTVNFDHATRVRVRIEYQGEWVMINDVWPQSMLTRHRQAER